MKKTKQIFLLIITGLSIICALIKLVYSYGENIEAYTAHITTLIALSLLFYYLFTVKTDQAFDIEALKLRGQTHPYVVRHRDGSPVDPNAEYFVLRLDEGGKDPEHVRACRIAIQAYAMNVSHHLPVLANELLQRYSRVKR